MTDLEYKIVILGGGGVGKSAITLQFVRHEFVEEYDPTIEDSYRKQVEIDEQIAMLDILDTAGQEEFRAMRDQYMQGGEGFILVYAINSRDSFEEITPIRDQILRVKDMEKVPLVILGNKCDLEREREITKAEGEELTKSLNGDFFEVSALERINIEESFFNLVRQIRKARAEKHPTKKAPTKKKAPLFKCALL
eukprot:TRINITY_DN50755_c0_g1_i1.p1 TRINITY_DN50755_c0_g1~~TRINITY_DN50755_c0_g1_i1.p1  ORF type:complete len:201 (+),score=38.01 TRINITY_DN50755_c0_g1_i1:23-604(+)